MSFRDRNGGVPLQGPVKVFSKVILEVRVLRLLVILCTIVQGLKRVWGYKNKEFYIRTTKRENLLFLFFLAYLY